MDDELKDFLDIQTAQINALAVLVDFLLMLELVRLSEKDALTLMAPFIIRRPPIISAANDDPAAAASQRFDKELRSRVERVLESANLSRRP